MPILTTTSSLKNTAPVARVTPISSRENPAETVLQPVLSKIQALRNPAILNAIAQAVAPHELRNLGHVDEYFYGTVHTPPVWARQYSPATIDWPARTVVTSLAPLPPDGIRKVYDTNPDTIDLTRSLGCFDGEEWYLKYGKQEKKTFSADMAKILDKLTEMRFEGVYYYRIGQTPEEAFQIVLEENRDKAYTYIKDRLYRLEHNLPISIYTSGAKAFFFLGITAAAAIVGLIQLDSKVKDVKSLTGSIGIHVGMTICIGTAAISGLFIALGLMFGGESGLRNMLVGPIDHYRINQWAREIPRLEADAREKND